MTDFHQHHPNAAAPETNQPSATATSTARVEVALVVRSAPPLRIEHEVWISVDHLGTGSCLFQLLEERGLAIGQGHRIVVERSGRDIQCCTQLEQVGLISGDRLRIESHDAPRTVDTGDASVILQLLADDEPEDALIIRDAAALGRDGEPGISLVSGPTVSRQHALLSVSPTGAEITDLDSLNGTTVNGLGIDRTTQLVPGDRIRLASEQAIVQLSGLPARSTSGPHLAFDAGTIQFNRPPRTITPMPDAAMELPTAPATPPRRRFPLLASVAPLGMGIMMAILFSPIYALFTAMTPVMMAFTFIDDRRSGRKQFRAEAEEFRASLDDFASEANDRNDLLAAYARAATPSLHVLRWWARAVAPVLWHHRPRDVDFLLVAPADVDRRTLLDIAPSEDGDEDLLDEVDDLIEDLPPVPQVPVIIDLQRDAIVGLCGPREQTAATARAMVAQLAGLVSPRFLKIAVIAPQHREEWEWAKWLPHCESSRDDHRLIAGDNRQASFLLEWLERLIEERREDSRQHVTGAQESALPRMVAVVQGPIEVSRRTLTTILDNASLAGISVLFVGQHLHDLPAQTDVIVELRSGSCDVTFAATGTKTLGARPRQLSPAEARDYARDLAPLVDVTAASIQGSIPRSVDAGELFGDRAVSVDAVLARWREQNGDLEASIGVTADDVFGLDLRRDGPHALVAGTTGSGKSEFLQSLVASMALEHSPTRLNFILIDYKGGAAFSDCVEFPHTVGYVTNLDDRLAERALTSLRAELRRRERLLLAAGAKDLITLERQDPEAAPPALVIVIDEFAALKTEVPDFVDGLVDIAQRGRSLGVHMILATQKPSGVITAQIEANTNIRIALRVAGASESTEVLGVPAAADISNRTPGRSLIKVGARAEDIVEMQAVYVGGHSLGDVTYPDTAQTLSYGMDRPKPPRPELAASMQSDLAVMVTATQQAWRQLGDPHLHRPWLEELATVVPLADLAPTDADAGSSAVLVGLADLPDEQTQAAFAIDFEAVGNVALYGAPGSGKTTLLRTLASSVAQQYTPADASIYCVDCTTGGLSSLAPLPNVADVIDGREIDTVQLLLAVLARQLDGRRTTMGQAGAANLSEWRALRPQDCPPMVIVMIDGFGQLWSALEELRLYQTSADLLRLIVDSRSVGIHFVLTGDKRSALPTQVTSAVGLTLVQRMANDDDYSYLNLQGAVPTDLAPGRTLSIEGGEFQAAVCSTPAATTAASQAQAIHELGQGLAASVAPTALKLPSLPARLGTGELGLSLALDALPVGFDDFLDEVTINLQRSSLVLVLGPNGSGRSSALEMIGHQLRHLVPERLAIAVRRGSALADSQAFTHITTRGAPEQLERLAEITAQRCASGWEKRLLVAIDDAEDFLDGPGSEELSTLVRRSAEAGVIVVAAANSFVAANSYSSWVRMMASTGTGIALQPQGRDDTDAFGVNLPIRATDSFPVGRGLMIAQRQATVTQLALAEYPAEAAAKPSRPVAHLTRDLPVADLPRPGQTGGLSPYPETVRSTTMASTPLTNSTGSIQ